MSTYPKGRAMEQGIENLDKVAAWLDKNLTRLPRGTCPSD